MDTLTHALSGALLCRAIPGANRKDAASNRARMVVGAIAAAFPDIDYLASFVSPLTYLLHHRGVTHSVLLLPLWALLLAWLAGLAFRNRSGWRPYYGVAVLGLAAHIAGDLITSYGTMVFAPFARTRYGWGTTFIIDLWFSGIILAGLALSAVWRHSRLPAIVSSVVLAGYVGFQAVLKAQAVELGVQYANSIGMKGGEVSAHPGPVSPFNWAVYVRSSDDYRYSFVNLAGRERRPAPGPDAGLFESVAAPHQPPAHVEWRSATLLGRAQADIALAREAWSQPSLDFFRWFAEFPALYRIDRGNPSECVWFYDLRFFRPGTDRLPFRFGLCREEGAAWQRYQLISDTERLPFN